MKKITTLMICLTLLFAASGCSEQMHNLPVTTTAAATVSTTVSTTTVKRTTAAAVTSPAATTSSAVTTLPIATTTATATTAATTTSIAAATTATTAVTTTAATTATTEVEDTPVLSDKYIEIDGSFIEACDPFDEKSISRFAEKMKSVKSKYPDNRAVLALIPDKSYYAIETIGEKALDHTLMTTALSQNLSGWSMVELSDLYTWDDFYLTDLHWRQEILLDTATRLGSALGISIDTENFTDTTIGPFYGIYAQSASESAEELVLLDHPDFADVTVKHYEKPCTSVYDLDAVDSDNSYDVFLSGASPLTVITNPHAEKGTSLLVFRDSFASSLVPLLIPNYETITMVDLRYMHSSLLKQFVPTTDGDILFLYSARVVNNSAMLR